MQNAKQLIGELPFFQGFPSHLLQLIESAIIPLSLNPDQALFEQGSNNDSLYFLVSGKLAIEVDGEIVSILQNSGEVIGEMSLINKVPVAATVRALDQNVELLQLRPGDLVGRAPELQREWETIIYRLFAGILSDRLRKTNSKAKKFEIANRELESAHKRLQAINENLEAEIKSRSEEIVNKVRSLTQSHLQPAQQKLAKAVGASGEIDLLPVLRDVSEVIDFLKPIADLGARTGVARRVMIIDGDKKQLNTARLALGGTAVQLKMVSTLEAIQELPQGEKFDLILVDANQQAIIQLMKQRWPETPSVYFVSNQIQDYLRALKENLQQNVFVSRDPENKTFNIKNISSSVSKILSRNLFGMDKYLGWGTQIVERVVYNSNERASHIEEMKLHFQSFGIRNSILDRVHTVAEEMLMNAIFDAPHDAKGKSLYNHLPRTDQVRLPPEQAAKLRFGTDGILLGVSVADPFGALKKETIMNYLDSIVSGDSNRHEELRQGKGGAGRGLYVLTHTADLTIFNVKSNSMTEVISLFHLDASKDEALTPSFHLFFE